VSRNRCVGRGMGWGSRRSLCRRVSRSLSWGWCCRKLAAVGKDCLPRRVPVLGIGLPLEHKRRDDVVGVDEVVGVVGGTDVNRDQVVRIGG
jgi:hypothetical protein